jgi:hypothetical protein
VPGTWELAGFSACLDRWSDQESPGFAILEAVVGWIMARRDDPYRGVQREPDFPNLWFGKVPGTTAKGTVVCCSYFVEAQRRMVVCDSIATLNLPV